MQRLAAWICMVVLLPLVLAQDPTPYPTPSGKKGLQVQMVDDALARGIQHAAINVSLGELLPRGDAATLEFVRDGRTRRFAAGYVAALDAQIAPLSQAGVVVTAILLAMRSGDAARDALVVHGGCGAAAPNGIGAFATDTTAGCEWLGDAVAFLACRYAGTAEHGRLWNWIVGNEVNSHFWWYHMGEAEPAAVVEAYAAALRIVHSAVREHSVHGRVFVSLEHHWATRYQAGNARQAMPGRELLAALAAQVRARGDFDWHVAFHPYPEDLFDCAFWEDTTARDHDDTARVTFNNLPVLLRRLAKADLRYGLQVRRVLLSEQGFHCAAGTVGELRQAAAYALAASIVDRLPGIDALVLHRHVDHAHEGGLNLGLWTRRADSVCTPLQPRRMAAVFSAWGTSAAESASAFALPIVGRTALTDFPLGGVRAEADGELVQVTVDGAPFATLHANALPRPFVWPLLGPEGETRTRAFPMAKMPDEVPDHPHHQSLWFAHGAVNGFDFWHSKDHHERQVRSSPLELRHEADAAVVGCDYQWLAERDQAVVHERRQWRFSRRADLWCVDFHTELRGANGTALVFGDTKEGSFALRVHPNLRVQGPVASGTLRDSQGRSNDAVWGNRAAWIATTGVIAGKTLGLALLDDPHNHGFPTHWHARTYGLLASNPFGLHDFGKGKAGAGELTVPAGESLRLHYRVVLFTGEWTDERAQQAMR